MKHVQGLISWVSTDKNKTSPTQKRLDFKRVNRLVQHPIKVFVALVETTPLEQSRALSFNKVIFPSQNESNSLTHVTRWKIRTSYAWDDGTLLDSRRLLKTIGVDTTEQILTKVHLIEVVGNLVPITLNNTIWLHARWPIRRLHISIFFK